MCRTLRQLEGVVVELRSSEVTYELLAGGRKRRFDSATRRRGGGGRRVSAGGGRDVSDYHHVGAVSERHSLQQMESIGVGGRAGAWALYALGDSEPGVVG